MIRDVDHSISSSKSSLYLLKKKKSDWENWEGEGEGGLSRAKAALGESDRLVWTRLFPPSVPSVLLGPALISSS